MTLASRRGDGVVSAEVLCFPTPASRAPLAPRLPFLDRRAEHIEMPVITVNNLQYPLRPGQNRLGSGDDADVKITGVRARGVQAIIDVASNSNVVIRRVGARADVRVNGIALVDPTPLMHGDKVEIGGNELLYADDTKSGHTTMFVSPSAEMASFAQRRSGSRATKATGGRLVSLVDGKEYAIPDAGITIGRDASANVVVPQREVSRKHAEVVPVQTGYEIRDYSANGVFVNGTRVEQVQLLSRADVISIGTEEFRFYADVRSTPPISRVAQLEDTALGTPAVSKSTARVPDGRPSAAVKAVAPVARPSATVKVAAPVPRPSPAVRVAPPDPELSAAVTIEAPVPPRALMNAGEPGRPGFLAWVWFVVALAVVAAAPFFLLNR